MATSPDTIPLSEMNRPVIEAEVERLIGLLDEMDNDPDLEPDETDQDDDGEPEESDDDDDGELSGDENEPSLAASETGNFDYYGSWHMRDLDYGLGGSQLFWSAGNTDDREGDEHDGSEPDEDGEPDLGVPWAQEADLATTPEEDATAVYGDPNEGDGDVDAEPDEDGEPDADGEPDCDAEGHAIPHQLNQTDWATPLTLEARP